MGKFLGNLGWRIGFIFIMSSFMAAMPLMAIWQTDIEFLQNFQALSLTMFAATITTSMIFWLKSRGK